MGPASEPGDHPVSQQASELSASEPAAASQPASYQTTIANHATASQAAS